MALSSTTRPELLLVLLVASCSSGKSPGDDHAGMGGSAASAGSGATAGTTVVTAGRGGSSSGAGGSAGKSGMAAAGQGAGGAGAAGGSAGTTALGGGAGTLGASGAGASPGGAAGTGGVGGAAAGTGPGGGQGGDTAGAAGAAGMLGMAGAAGGSGLHGGASGKFVCAPGASYGDPLAGIGAVASIGPPTQGTPNYFGFVEGPVWIASLGKLFFSDNSNPERIWVLSPGMMPTVFQDMSKSNGMALDSDDQLIVTDQVGNRITRLDPTSATPAQAQIAAAGCKPNDIVVRSDGNIYYSSPNGTGTGFYRISPAGMVSGPRTDVGSPNGIVLSPDENTLYVGDVQNKTITKFVVAADGSIGATGEPFATAMSGTVDGMCVDCGGNVYAGTSNGVEVFSPVGMPRGIVPTGESSNCTFGGTDRKTLYVTSRSVIKSVTLAVPGLPD